MVMELRQRHLRVEALKPNGKTSMTSSIIQLKKSTPNFAQESGWNANIKDFSSAMQQLLKIFLEIDKSS
jgi:hypothetical protein